MNMKLFLAALLLSMTTCVFAQRQGGTPEEMAKRTTDWMTESLKLKKEQVTKVDSINLVFARKQSELFRNAQGGDRSQMRESMLKLNEEKEKALKPILTAEQLATYKKELENRRNRRGNGGGGGGGGGR